MKIKDIIKKIIYKERCSQEEYIKYLKKIGISIGSNCRIFDPKTNIIDIQNPYLLTIGENVKITSGVIILTHDYSWSVIANVKGEILGNVGYVNIGNNVFIGMNSIILKNTKIGDNVIIGAGSIVSGNIESNSVYAGNPAKKIMSIDEFYKKRKEQQMQDIKLILKTIKNKYNRLPTKEELREYFWMYTNMENISEEDEKLIEGVGNKKIIYERLKDKENEFESMEELLKFCEENL